MDAFARLGRQRRAAQCDEIVDVEIVAKRASVAEHRELRAFGRAAKGVGDDAEAVARFLPRAIDVGGPQHDRGARILGGPGADEGLGRDLAGRVVERGRNGASSASVGRRRRRACRRRRCTRPVPGEFLQGLEQAERGPQVAVQLRPRGAAAGRADRRGMDDRRALAQEGDEIVLVGEWRDDVADSGVVEARRLAVAARTSMPAQARLSPGCGQRNRRRSRIATFIPGPRAVGDTAQHNAPAQSSQVPMSACIRARPTQSEAAVRGRIGEGRERGRRHRPNRIVTRLPARQQVVVRGQARGEIGRPAASASSITCGGPRRVD